MIYSCKVKKYESKSAINPNLGRIILAINILMIIGMFIYAKQYISKPRGSLYTFDNIECFFQAKLLSNKENYLLKLKIINKGRGSKLLKFTEPSYDFIIKREKKVVWHISGTNQKEVLLQPKAELYFSQIWNKRNKSGEAVDPGEYQAICRLNLTSPINISTYIKVEER